MDVKQVAGLANLPLDPKSGDKLQQQFDDTLKTVAQVNQLDTSNVEITSQVTGLVNITREDKVEPERILSQEQSLSQAAKTYNGYFVVPGVLNAD